MGNIHLLGSNLNVTWLWSNNLQISHCDKAVFENLAEEPKCLMSIKCKAIFWRCYISTKKKHLKSMFYSLPNILKCALIWMMMKDTRDFNSTLQWARHRIHPEQSDVSSLALICASAQVISLDHSCFIIIHVPFQYWLWHPHLFHHHPSLYFLVPSLPCVPCVP